MLIRKHERNLKLRYLGQRGDNDQNLFIRNLPHVVSRTLLDRQTASSNSLFSLVNSASAFSEGIFSSSADQQVNMMSE
jgi:hypothetical protein